MAAGSARSTSAQGDAQGPSMGPRPDGRGIHRLGHHYMSQLSDLQWGRDQMAAGSPLLPSLAALALNLQWGRDQMAAGSDCTGDSARGCQALQWGRDQMAAGSRPCAPSPREPKILQWGRDQMAAGSRMASRTGSATGTFNGAATRWPRDRKPHAKIQTFGLPSMGPRPDGRGIVPDQRRHGRHPHPSMGPRPDGRGIVIVAFALPTLADLQWGRDQMAAGSSARSRSCLVFGSFNGAATRWPRDPGCLTTPQYTQSSFNGAATRWPRDPLHCPGLLCHHWPSMGPRPDGRGILIRQRVHVGFLLPSMGSRPDGRGIEAVPGSTGARAHPFNGAATRWPRDP